MKPVVRNAQNILVESTVALLITVIFSSQALASTLKIIDGPTSMKTAIDMENEQAIVNFEYEGCDVNPDIRNIHTDTRCTPGECYSRTSRSADDYKKCIADPKNNRLGILQGSTGEVTFKYVNKNAPATCANKIKKNIVLPMKLGSLFSHFDKSHPNCKPTALFFKDTFKNAKHRYKNDGRLCELPWTKVAMPGDKDAGANKFGTDESNISRLEVKDNMFRFGDDLYFKYDPAEKQWHARFIERDAQGKAVRVHKPKSELSGDMATPIPVMFNRGGKTHLAASVLLNKDGTAVVRSHNKAFSNVNDLFKQRPYNNIVDESAGAIKIDMKNKEGVIRQTKVTAFDKDGKHVRTVELVGRNIFGNLVGESMKKNPASYNWCEREHCFRAGVDQGNLCKSKSKDIDMTQGANGNLCISCLGQTPGVCENAEPEYEQLTAKGEDVWENRFKSVVSGQYAKSNGVEAKRSCSKGVAPDPAGTPIKSSEVSGSVATNNAELPAGGEIDTGSSEPYDFPDFIKF